MDIQRINSIDKKIKKQSLSKENHICFASKLGIPCSEAAVNSHSYWKRGIIDHLAVENKVLTVGYDETELIKTVDRGDFYKEVSVKSANTFGGFCRIHDDRIFELIENNNSNPPYSIEQQFLFMVRALSYQFVHERDSRNWINRSLQNPYPKQIISDSEWKRIKNSFEIVKMHTEKEDILAILEPWFDNIKKCISQEKNKIHFDTDNINRLFRFKQYELKGKLDFAALGIYFPELVCDISERDDMAVFNVIPHSNGGYLLISYFPNSFIENNTVSLMDDLYAKDTRGDYIRAIIENLVVEHTENIILSPHISQERLDTIRKQFEKANLDANNMRNEALPRQMRIDIAESMTLFKWIECALFE